jgi:hypothetical protein
VGGGGGGEEQEEENGPVCRRSWSGKGKLHLKLRELLEALLTVQLRPVTGSLLPPLVNGRWLEIRTRHLWFLATDLLVLLRQLRVC